MAASTSIGDRLREARKEAGFRSAADAARRFAWNVDSYRAAENDHRAPGRKTVVKYARAFGINVDWLLTARPPKRGAGQLGEPSPEPAKAPNPDIAMHQTSWVQEVRPLAKILANSLLFEVAPDDDAMVDLDRPPASLYPGDSLIVDPSKPVNPGNMVLAREGKRTIVRRVRTITEGRDGQSDRVSLVASNPDYGMLEIPADKIVGVVTGWYRQAR